MSQATRHSLLVGSREQILCASEMASSRFSTRWGRRRVVARRGEEEEEDESAPPAAGEKADPGRGREAARRRRWRWGRGFMALVDGWMDGWMDPGPSVFFSFFF